MKASVARKASQGEVGDDTEPGEEGGSGGVEAGGVELGGERFALEVDGDVGEVAVESEIWLAPQEFALPLLRRRVVDLEDTQVGVGIAVGEGVEAGAEQDVLGDSARYGAGEEVFGVAAAGDKKRPQGDGEWPGCARCAAKFLAIGVAENWNSDGILEDERLVVELVRGAAQGDTEGGAGWDSLLHSLMVAEGWFAGRPVEASCVRQLYRFCWESPWV